MSLPKPPCNDRIHCKLDPLSHFTLHRDVRACSILHLTREGAAGLLPWHGRLLSTARLRFELSTDTIEAGDLFFFAPHSDLRAARDPLAYSRALISSLSRTDQSPCASISEQTEANVRFRRTFARLALETRTCGRLKKRAIDPLSQACAVPRSDRRTHLLASAEVCSSYLSPEVACKSGH